MPFFRPSEMLGGGPLPGWSGRFLQSANMTFAHYTIAADAAPLHEHQHEQEEVWHIVDGEVALSHRRRGAGARRRLGGGGATGHAALGAAAVRLAGHHRGRPAAAQPARPVERGVVRRGQFEGTGGQTGGRVSSTDPWAQRRHDPGGGHPCRRGGTRHRRGCDELGAADAAGNERHRCECPGRDPRLHQGPGRPVSPRPPGARRLLPRRRRRVQIPTLRALPRPGEAMELLCRRCLTDGAARIQRGAPGDDLERAGARNSAGQRPRHLRPRDSEGSAPVRPGRVRPLRATAAGDRGPAGAVPHLHDSGHAPGRLQRDVRRRGCPEAGPCARTACRAWTRRGAGPSSTPPRRPASPSTNIRANNVRGDLQGEYYCVWGDVAGAFKGTRGSWATTRSTNPSPRH